MLQVNSITLDKLAALANDLEITAIINGEYYTVKPGEMPTDNTEAFIEGVKFAAAYIIDNRSRRFFCWKAAAERKRTPKKEFDKALELNKEARYFSDCLIHIADDPGALKNAVNEYNNRGFWGL